MTDNYVRKILKQKNNPFYHDEMGLEFSEKLDFIPSLLLFHYHKNNLTNKVKDLMPSILIKEEENYCRNILFLSKNSL